MQALPLIRFTRNRLAITALLSACLIAGTSLAVSQTPPRPARPAAAAAPAAPPRPAAVPGQPITSDKDLTTTQAELIRLLKLSPTLTTVVARDPSLLANQEYVTRNNPQLAQFLLNHPEVPLNPEFYLFTHLHGEPGQQSEALERAVWPALAPLPSEHSSIDRIFDDFIPFMSFLCVTAALLWLVRSLLENRRWSRIFKLQTEVHGKLIEKFASTQELVSYMNTEPGRRFLEAAPIPVNFEQDHKVPSAVARILTPLQIGIVLTLLGLGFLSLRHADPQMDVPMLVIGTMIAMPGIGFILSAGLSWILAAKLGLTLSGRPAASSAATRPYDAGQGR